jgi:hypothetical protein
MSSSGPSSTPIDEKFLKHNLKDKRTTAVIWAFSWSEIVNYVLQIAGITAGIVFGVWAIKTYGATETSLAIAANANNVSTNALTQSKLANQLALLSFCAPHLEAIPPSEFVRPPEPSLNQPVAYRAETRPFLVPQFPNLFSWL